TGTKIGSRYEVCGQLGHYKEVFTCVDTSDGNRELVVKVERSEDTNRLLSEHKFYTKLSTTPCFDVVIDYLCDLSFRYLVMKPLGPNLYDLYRLEGKEAPDNDHNWRVMFALRYASQMVSRVANCHIRQIIHRDIKPENFVVDAIDEKYLYLIDFNLAKEYTNPLTGHIPYCKRNAAHSVGNVQFLSNNAHAGEQQSRRDDLISVGYSLVWLAKGCLPWSHLSSRKFPMRSDYLRVVGDMKTLCSLDELCGGLPSAFRQYMEYCLRLGFEEQPNYFHLRSLFADCVVSARSETQTQTSLEQAFEDYLTIDSKLDNISPHFKRKVSNIYTKFGTPSPPMICP
ncbi:unnamed protein product, partial [Oppiella nova]